LAIDDNLDNLMVIKYILAESFPEVTYFSAQSGLEGIELCLSVEPDVILLDVIMPGMDGYEACRILKSNEFTRIIPIIMISAVWSDKESRIKTLESGADAFLAKPIDEIEFIVHLKAMLRLKDYEDHKRSEKERLIMQVTERTKELEKAYDSMQKLLEDLTTENNYRRKIEVELRESEQKYRSIFENVQDIYYEVSLDGFILEISPSIEKISRGLYKRTDLIGKHVASLYVHSDDRNTLLSKIVDNTEVRDIELSFLNPDGSIFPCIVSSKLCYDKDGYPEKIIGSLHDISKRKQAEQSLLESNELNQSLLKTIPFGMDIVDKEGNILFQNDNLKKYIGQEPNGLKCWWKSIPDYPYRNDLPGKGSHTGNFPGYLRIAGEQSGIDCSQEQSRRE